ncbi:MAG: HAMP domain-containing sensor histidine kinase [Gemmatimonadaceae bacterium]
MTLRTRLTLGLLTIAVILTVPLLVATRSLNRLHDEAKKLRDGDFAASLLLGRLRDALNDLRTAEMAVLFVREEQSRSAMIARARAVETLADSLETYELDRAARDVRAAMSAVVAKATAEYQAAVADRVKEAERISTEEVVPAIARAEAAIASAERALRERTRERVVHAAAHAKQGSNAAIIGLALALIVAAVIAIKLTQSVSKPVQELEQGMRQVADGDFGAKLAISPSRTDEFGRLAASFDAMSRQLAELDKLKAEFVSVASHELKTPINVILGYTQLLQEELFGPLTDKQRNVANVLEKQTQTLSRLVKQLLDVTRFEAGGGKLDVRPVELSGFLHNLEEAFQVLADQRGIRFQVSAHDGLPQTVHWDADRINEVLGNLVSNAFKFTDQGGEVELTVLPMDHGVQMEVRDTGAGIPADQLPRIFDKFFQADNQGAGAQGGSGLGLAIARHIVEAHNGTISCESTPGVGTTFMILLPERAVGRRSSVKHPVMAEVG